MRNRILDELNFLSVIGDDLKQFCFLLDFQSRWLIVITLKETFITLNEVEIFFTDA